MPAYLLLVLAILTRVMPHHGWLNFTAVGGALLYFGARRSWREMLAPLAALMVTDYCLTVFAYHYSFVWTAYVTTWAWYLAVMVLGHILLKSKTTWLRFRRRRRARSHLVLPHFKLCGVGMSSHASGFPATCIRIPCPACHLLCGRRCRSIATTCSPRRSLQASPSVFPCSYAKCALSATRASSQFARVVSG